MQTMKWMMMAAAMTLGLSACKNNPETTSQTQSLDNFARTPSSKLQQNQCHGQFDLMADLFSPEAEMINIRPAQGQNAEALQAKVESALRAVPTEVQVAFFGIGGIVEVTPDAPAICEMGLDANAKENLLEGGTKIKGCWKHQKDLYDNGDGTLSEDPRVVIYVDADEVAIEHALVRTFGYVVSQVLVKLDHEAGQPALKTVAGDAEFSLAKEAITLAFLADVAQSNGKYDLSYYADMLGADVLSRDAMARRTAWDQLRNSKSADTSRFMDYVFAEAFDSRYCSDATRSTMVNDFPSTHAAYAPVDTALEGLSSELETKDSVDQLVADPAEGAAVQPAVKPTTKPQTADVKPGTTSNVDRNIYLTGSALWGGRIFGGIARVIGAVGRGIFRVGQAAVIGAGRLALGALRIGAAIIRGTGRVALAIFRGAARIARGAVIGAGMLIRGAARLTLGAGRLIIRATGAVIRGTFGNPEAYASEAGMVLNTVIYDQDGDGVADQRDFCSNTIPGYRVHQAGEWSGCAGGQYKDVYYAWQ